MCVAFQPRVRPGYGMGRWRMAREGKLRVDVWFLWRPMKRAWQLEQRVFKGWSPAVLATVTRFSSGPHADYATLVFATLRPSSSSHRPHSHPRYVDGDIRFLLVHPIHLARYIARHPAILRTIPSPFRTDVCPSHQVRTSGIKFGDITSLVRIRGPIQTDSKSTGAIKGVNKRNEVVSLFCWLSALNDHLLCYLHAFRLVLSRMFKSNGLSVYNKHYLSFKS